MPFVHLPVKFYEERKPVDTVTQGREALITVNCNFSKNMLNRLKKNGLFKITLILKS